MFLNGWQTMLETVGKRLQKERLSRQLTIDQVAEATKIRPERVVDLEADDYAHFPNLTYAKSFLAKYAKFLELNIQEELDSFEVNRSVSLRDYQYLTTARPKYVPEPRAPMSRGFRVPPLLVAILVLLVLVGVPLFSYFALTFSGVRKSDQAVLTAPDQSPGLGTGNQETLHSTPPASPARAEAASPAVPAAAQTALAEANARALSPTASPAQRIEGGVVVRRALPVQPDSALTEAETNSVPVNAKSTPLAIAKLEVRALKPTRITLTKDDKSSEPVFDGMANPNSQPIVVQGSRFWLKVQDKSAVEVRRNGQIIQQNGDGVVID